MLSELTNFVSWISSSSSHGPNARVLRHRRYCWSHWSHGMTLLYIIIISAIHVIVKYVCYDSLLNCYRSGINTPGFITNYPPIILIPGGDRKRLIASLFSSTTLIALLRRSEGKDRPDSLGFPLSFSLAFLICNSVSVCMLRLSAMSSLCPSV